MSNKKQKNNSAEDKKDVRAGTKSAATKSADSKSKLSEKNLAILITAIVLLTFIVGTSAFFLVDAIINNKFFSYRTSNLSNYVTLSKESYKGNKINVDIAKPHDIDVDVAILALLASDKGDAKYNGNSVSTADSDFVITAGAELKLWYRGYLLDDEGGKIDVAGMSNLTNGTPASLEIGSGGFIPGFELGLLGKNTADYAKFVKIKDASTDIVESHVAYVSFSRLAEGADAKKDTEKVASARIELSADDVDDNFGTGFKAKLLGATIGEKMSFEATIDGKKYNYTDVTVDFVTDCESNPIKVTTYFPYDYSTATLRNETAYFEVYVESGVLYEEQNFDDAYVEELVKREGSNITLEELNEFDGSALTDKYRAYVKKTIDDLYAEEYEKAVTEAVWNNILASAKIEKYPKAKVDKIHEEYIQDVKDQFDSTGGYLENSYGESKTYEDINSFARAYLGLSSTADWQKHLYSMSESLVKERLVLYYIMREEGLMPTKKELKSEIEKTKEVYLDEYVQQYLDYEEKKREDFTDAEYEEYVEARASEIFGYYDDDYFEETTLYDLATKEMVKWPEVVTLDQRRAYPLDK